MGAISHGIDRERERESQLEISLSFSSRFWVVSRCIYIPVHSSGAFFDSNEGVTWLALTARSNREKVRVRERERERGDEYKPGLRGLWYARGSAWAAALARLVQVLTSFSRARACAAPLLLVFLAACALARSPALAASFVHFFSSLYFYTSFDLSRGSLLCGLFFRCVFLLACVVAVYLRRRQRRTRYRRLSFLAFSPATIGTAGRIMSLLLMGDR